MRKTSTFFALALLASGAFCQTIPNGDFESFTGDDPDGWLTLNIATVGAPVTTSSTDAHGGALAVINRPQIVFNTNFYPVLTLGADLTGLAPIELGGNFNGVQGWIKTNLESEDETVLVSQSLYADATGMSPVGGSLYTTSETLSEWTFFETIFATIEEGTPTHYTISAAMSNDAGSTANTNSFFMLDDLSLSNSVISVSEIQESPELFVYPNPAEGKMHLHIKNNALEEATIRLVDALGNIAMEVTPNSGYFQSNNYLKLDGLSAGIYTLMASTQNGNVAKRVILQ